MIRTQVQLTEGQMQALWRLWAETGFSIAELVRQVWISTWGRRADSVSDSGM